MQHQGDKRRSRDRQQTITFINHLTDETRNLKVTWEEVLNHVVCGEIIYRDGTSEHVHEGNPDDINPSKIKEIRMRNHTYKL